MLTPTDCLPRSSPIFQDRSQQVLPPLRISESHIGAVQNVAFGSKINELFATCGRDRTVRVWDSSDYTVRMEASVSKADVFPTCVAMTLDSEIVLSGWNDGKIRAYLVNPEDRKEHGSNKAWEISDVAAGRGISNIVLSNNERFFVTGGYDGMVRVWGYSGHELVTQLKQVSGGVYIYRGRERLQTLHPPRRFLACIHLKHIHYHANYNTVTLTAYE